MLRTLPSVAGAVVAAALALLAPASALARPGDLDPTFAGGGPLVIVLPGAAATGGDVASSVAVDAQRRVLAGGSTTARTAGAPNDAVVLRTTADGRLDTAFGDGGAFRRQFSARLPNDPSTAVDVAPAPGGGVGFGVQRYTNVGLGGGAVLLGPTGQPDVEHGTGGFAEGRAPAADPNGKLTTFASTSAGDGSAFVTGWYSSSQPGQGPRLGLLRLTPQGQPDAGFGVGGLAIRNLGQQASDATTPNALALLPGDDRLLVAGSTDRGGRTVAFVTKLEASTGFFDSSFTDAGVAARYLDPASPGAAQASSGARSLALGPDGSIYVGGSTTDSPQTQGQAWVAKLRATGEPDPSWGTDGIVRLQLSRTGHSSRLEALAVQADGRLVAGATADDAEPTLEGDVLRFDPDGRLDRTFGDQGIARLRLGGKPTSVRAIALDGSRLVLGGFLDGSSYVARMLLADPPAEQPQPGPGQTPGGTPTTPGGTPTTPGTPTRPATPTVPGATPTTTAPPPTASSRGRLAVLTRSVRVDARGRVALRVRCSSTGPCADRLLVVATKRGTGTRSASVTARLAAGRTATVRVKLTTAARRALRRGRTLRAFASVVPAGGGARTTTPLAVRRR